METAVIYPPALVTQPETTNESIAVKPKKIRAPKHDFKDGQGRVFAHRHDNGRGWVADTAKVEDTVYVGSRCSVYNFATLRGDVRMEGAAQAYGHCHISGNAKLKKLARVSGRAVVRDTVALNDTCVVTDHAVINGDAQIFDGFVVAGHATVNSSRLCGHGRISGEAHLTRTSVSGTVFIENRAILVHATVNGRVKVCGYSQILNSTLNGMFYGNAGEIVVGDFAVVADQSRIQVPIEIKNHAVIVRSSISGYSSDWLANGTLLFGGQLVVSGRSFMTRVDIDNFINGRDRYGNPIPEPPVVGMAGRSNQQRSPVSVTPAPRRIMRPQEAEA